MNKKIILGSQSPRRREILSYFTLPFDQITPPFDEESISFTGDPMKFVNDIARGKAEALKKQYPQSVIITADTAVYCQGKVYGKPAHDAEAFKALCELVGHWHSVFTGVAVAFDDKIEVKAEETRVLFNALTPQQIRHYQRQIHGADKAGGYAIQSAGGLIVKKIEGCYYNVMGLPINTLYEMLLHAQIDLWDYLPPSEKL